MKFKNILFVFVLSIFSMGLPEVYGQEASFPGTETEDVEVYKERDKLMSSPGELDPSFRKNQTVTLKDSMAVKPMVRPSKVQTPDASKQPAKQPSQDDDSILSFNFLYYIFQKYKMQDIVD